ncbi:hypothetical protein CONLIGDRAFT_249548 [Coniochaeta ligniaria NRRL 30616]|uniref:Uncharacterized protein n=1 Tax=Coniochaeta ligniaria NRRL 30616 TaxID=1408157 RepID=A0A1J7IWY5_9PEZI|nr:hypothetical protein CONLIGDRAFT_249548 [Coniochaeta ligniaria NRRL 30616]
MGCMELTIDPEWAWEPRKGFRGLPRELRDTIYNMVLIEPSKWERRHSPLCDLCPRDTGTFERPVFDDKSSCKCRLRRNMGLLLANRQLHRETAPTFWSQNAFHFDTASDFAENVGSNLRQEYVELLQRVSILRVTWQDYQTDWSTRRERPPSDSEGSAMWQALFRCTALKYVEMGTENIFRTWTPFGEEDFDVTSFIPKLRARLPQLKEFALAMILVYDVNPKTSRVDLVTGWWDAPPMSQRHLLYIKATKPTDLDEITTADEAKEAVRSFNTNFAVHVRFALETTLLGVDENNFSTDPNDLFSPNYALANDLNDNNTSQVLNLRDETAAIVRLLGLPISQQTRIRHVKERWREDARRKSAGKPTVWEEKYRSVMQERQEAKRAQRVEDAAKAHQARKDARETRREEAEAQEQRQQRKAQAKERSKLARSERHAQEIREAERKRVRSPK